MVTLPTAEAEFIAASSNLGFPQSDLTQIFEDNATCIKWAGDAVGGSDHAKHIDLREHFVHEAQSNKVLQLEPVDSADNAVDLLTKQRLKAAFSLLRKHMMGF